MLTALLLFPTMAGAVLSVQGSSMGCPTYSFQPKARLDVSAIKRLARDPQFSGLTTPTGAELVTLPFDDEDHPADNHLRALAVVYVTRGDLGERSLGGVLFQARSSAPINFGAATVVKRGGSVSMDLPTGGSCPRYTIRLENNGTLIVHGRVIGRLP